MRDESCLFCRIVSGDVPSHRIHEDESTIAFLDIRPLSEGHTLVVPRAHWKDIFEIPPDEAAALGRSVATVAALLDRSLHPDGMNVFQTNRKAAGQEVFHIHVHLVPRRQGDGLFRGIRPMSAVPDLESLAGRILG